MENSELKHLAGYLPYGLKGVSTEEYQGIETVKGLNFYGKNNIVNVFTDYDDIDLILFKPILRPLSDLTKEIEVNGEKFVPIEKLAEIEESATCRYSLEFFKECTTELPYWIIQKLYEWHYDIHGGIGTWAIDINTLNK